MRSRQMLMLVAMHMLPVANTPMDFVPIYNPLRGSYVEGLDPLNEGLPL